MSKKRSNPLPRHKRPPAPPGPPPSNNVPQTPQNVQVGVRIDNGAIAIDINPPQPVLRFKPQDAMSLAQALGNAAQAVLQEQAKAQPMATWHE